MDTTKTYIKICEKAEEIQAVCHSTKEHYSNGFEGSFYAHSYNWEGGERQVHCVDYEYDGRYETTDIWLPRQDQLQEMIDKNWDTPGNMFCTGIPGLAWSDETGYDKEDGKDFDYYQTFSTWEQLC